MWRDLLRVFFNMPVHYLYGGSSSSYVTHTALDQHVAVAVDPSEAWPDFTKVPRHPTPPPPPRPCPYHTTPYHITHPLTHPLTLTLTHPHSHILAHALTHPPSPSPSHTHSPTHPLSLSPSHCPSLRCLHDQVLTVYGSGTVLSFRPEDSMYRVQLPFGVAFLVPSAILGRYRHNTRHNDKIR